MPSTTSTPRVNTAMRDAFIQSMREAPRGPLFDRVAKALRTKVGTKRVHKGWFVFRHG